MIQRIGANGDLVSKARESLVSFQRLLMYVQQASNVSLSQDQRGRFKSTLRDVQWLSSSTAFSQYRFGRPAGYLPQTHTGLGRSLFEQPHRIVANASYTFQKTGTTLSTVYFGESGQRFHYLYGGGSSGDLNCDGIGNDHLLTHTSTLSSTGILAEIPRR